jgi:hypothetical protein
VLRDELIHILSFLLEWNVSRDALRSASSMKWMLSLGKGAASSEVSLFSGE